MKKIKNILIFGAGNCGRRHFQDINNENKYNIVGFIDNDINKQGSMIFEKIVIAPSAIDTIHYDHIMIASVYESEIRKQLIDMRLEDKILGRFTSQEPAISTPVNFNEFDCSKEKITADALYAFNIAKNYINGFKQGIQTIQKKSILELGPGINLGTALILLCWGAKKVTVSDRFLAQYSDDYHTPVYQAIMNLLLRQNKDVNVQPIVECITQQSHKTQHLLAIQTPLEELSNIFPNQFDITLSNAVFEHLYNPMKAFKSLFQCMSTGAIGSHQVDFRDHRNFDRPLEFLLLDELSFHDLMHDASCEFGNRVRPYQMQAMFKTIGFKSVELNVNMHASEDYLNNFLLRLDNCKYSTFSEVSAKHLSAISAHFLIEK